MSNWGLQRIVHLSNLEDLLCVVPIAGKRELQGSAETQMERNPLPQIHPSGNLGRETT